MATTITFGEALTFSSSFCFNMSRVKSPNYVFIKPSNVSAPIIPSFSLFRRRINHHEGEVLSSSRTFPKLITSCMGTDMSDSPDVCRRYLVLTPKDYYHSSKRQFNSVCAGCQKHHKLVDNLGLIVEYDFRKEEDMDLGSNQD
ncbi:hypothetical protein MKX01_024201 [Papaver californicum]|nr:hypothetical protein MKX01_024201 [Papaver californicum]